MYPRDGGADRRLSILVVDDEAPIRELLVDLLTEGGFHVVEAGDGKEAMRRVRRDQVDLVIMDLVMPEQEGLESIRQLQKESPHIKVIAISGYQQGAFLYHAERFGARATIKKPFTAAVLLRTVATVLGSGPADGAGATPGGPGSDLEKEGSEMELRRD